jgi:hypothetical protein
VIHLAAVHRTCEDPSHDHGHDHDHDHAHGACTSEIPAWDGSSSQESGHGCESHTCGSCLLCGTMFKSWAGAPSLRPFGFAAAPSPVTSFSSFARFVPRAPATELPLSRGPPSSILELV